MIPNDPFIRLILYLLLAGCAVWALKWLLAKIGVPDPFNWVIALVLGLGLLVMAFNMAGIPIFA